MSFLEKILSLASRYSHAAMAFLLISVVAMIVLPIPPVVLDMLIAFNISLSVLLLMLSLYVSTALGMSTFPSLIVLTTVLRLSLNIASTKQILLHAHAGNIIETFGRMVMGGQVVVGLVVFSIIAVVQFNGISKGAERVAEVGARFTLDALPGKQMTIEADLRGGFIDKNEARRLRSLLEQESHMHGSMDGAMKFVKGDAIASILIAIVNIVGGISIGTGVKGMDLTDAISRYTLLSIGDGMVSQIPSLLTSIAAGLLITRIAGQEGKDRNLASQIGMQITDQPFALLTSSGIMVGFLLVPGFPKIPFLALALFFGYVGLRALRKKTIVPSFEKAGETSTTTMQNANIAKLTPSLAPMIVVPLLLRIADNLRDRLSPAVLQRALEQEKNKLQQELGIPFPDLQVRFDAGLSDNQYAIDVQEIPAHQSILSTTASENSSHLEEDLSYNVSRIVRIRPDAFVGTQEINGLLKTVQSQLPDLSEEVMRAMPMQRVADILRRLALEGVSLRYLREIFESLLIWSAREKDTAMLCEYVRIDLGRFICHRLVDSNNDLHVIALDPAADAQVKAAIQQGPNGNYLALPADVARDLMAGLEKAVKEIPDNKIPILLTTLETRRFLKKISSARLPQLNVVSYSELQPNITVKTLSRVSTRKSNPLRVVAD